MEKLPSQFPRYSAGELKFIFSRITEQEVGTRGVGGGVSGQRGCEHSQTRLCSTPVFFFGQMAGGVCAVADCHQQTRGGLKGASQSRTPERKKGCGRHPHHGGEEGGAVCGMLGGRDLTSTLDGVRQMNEGWSAGHFS